MGNSETGLDPLVEALVKAMGEQREQHTSEQYAALGEFFTEFGQLFHWHRQMLILMLAQRKILNDVTIAEIILGNHAITPDPFIQMTESIFGHLFGQDKIGMEIFSHIMNRYRKVNVTRNDLAHGVLFIGWGNALTDHSTFRSFKIKPTKKGVNYKDLPKSAKELKMLTKEAQDVLALLTRFFGCITLQSTGSQKGAFAKNFSKNSEGKWDPTPEKKESKK